ncbi:MAG: hypothetical protein WBG62_21505, partial [Cyclobacteriaceae bacterium]
KVRLAFSVAAHLEPEILIIDEVLAVGDQEFQRKCLGKMKDVAGSGRTVLFVSHNMTAVKSLCHRAILLNGGKKVYDGDVEQAISRYLGVQSLVSNSQHWTDMEKAPGNDFARITKIEARKSGGVAEDPINMDDPVEVEIQYTKLSDEGRLDLNIQLVYEDEILFASSTAFDSAVPEMPAASGNYTVTCRIPSHFLNSGNFSLNVLMVKDYRSLSYKVEQAVQFAIVQREAGEGGWMGRSKGPLRPRLNWDLSETEVHN